MHRFHFIARRPGSRMWRLAWDAPAAHMEVLVNRGVSWSLLAREHLSNQPCGGAHLLCGDVCGDVCVLCATVGHTKHTHPRPPPRALSHFIICSPAPGCSGTSRPLWIHLLLLFSTDNWLQQWNACPPPPPSPLKPYPLFILEVSFLLLSLSEPPSLHHARRLSAPPLASPFTRDQFPK